MDLMIRQLRPADADVFSRLLHSDNAEYSRYFVPFADSSTEALKVILREAKQDGYWGLFVRNELAGFCMLRGFDAGYERPSFGVYIAQRHAKLGLGTLALRYCMSWCRTNAVSAMMLKVHPENQHAKTMYEANGFVQIGVDAKNDNLIMEKRWR